MRTAIRYARSGPAKYISHLDMQRAIGRAIRRAHLSACYSQGFNPHMLLSFASPLSVGYETQSDYAELKVEDTADLQAYGTALEAAFPPGIRLRGLYRIPDDFGKLMARSHSAEYELRYAVRDQADCEALHRAAVRLAEAESYVAADRKGREKDVIPLIYRLDAGENGMIRLHLANSSGRSLNPELPGRILLQEAGMDLPFSVCRTECFALDEEGLVKPFADLLVRVSGEA